MTFYQGGLTVRQISLFAAALAGFLIADPVALKVQGPDSAGNPVPVAAVPAGAAGTFSTSLVASSTGAATALTENLPGAAGVTTYISGFEVTGGGATAASIIQVTVSGTKNGSLQYSLAIPAGVTAGVQLIVEFTQPIPASAANTDINVNVPSFGAGNTNASAAARGFRQ